MTTVGLLTLLGLRAQNAASVPLPVDCRAVLFDLDGVLVDSTASVERHWAAFAARHGLELQAIRHATHGRRSPDTIREVAPHLNAEAEGLRIDRDQAQDSDGLRPIAGAARLVAALSGATWAVVTSGPRFLAEARLRMVGLPLPDVLVSGDAVQLGKPDPGGYLAAAGQLGVYPAECLVFEDAPAGASAATAASMPVIGVLTHHHARELPGLHAAVHDLRSVHVVHADRDRIGLHVWPAAA
jgi:sugar-phosphatase